MKLMKLMKMGTLVGLLTLSTLLLGVRTPGTIVAAQENVKISIDQSQYTLPIGWEEVTKQAYTRRLAMQAGTVQNQTTIKATLISLEDLIIRIDARLPVYSGTGRVKKLLQYIRTLAEDDILLLSTSLQASSTSNTPSSPNTLPTPTPPVVPDVMKPTTKPTVYPVAGFDDTQTVLLGSNRKNVVGEFIVNARLEPFKFEEIEIVCEGTDGSPLLESVSIANKDGTQLGTTSLTGSGSTIDGSVSMNYRLEPGEEKFYLVAKSLDFSSSSEQLTYGDVNCGVSISEATGVFSGSNYSSPVQSNIKFSIQPVIVGGVAFVQQFNGFNVADTISQGVESTLGIVTIAADQTNALDNRSRDEELMLQTITLKVSGAMKSYFVSDLTLQRLDRSSSTKVQGTRIDTDTVRFALSGSSEGVRIVESGTLAGFRIQGVTNKTSGTVKLIFEDVSETALTYRGNSPTPVYTGVVTGNNYLESPSVRID